MVPSGTYDEESALLNGEGMFYNKYIELFENKYEDNEYINGLKNKDGQSRNNSTKLNRDSISINQANTSIVKINKDTSSNDKIKNEEKESEY